MSTLSIQNHGIQLLDRSAAVDGPVEPVAKTEGVGRFQSQAIGPAAILSISSQAAHAAEASGAAAAVQQFVRHAGADPSTDSNSAVSPDGSAFGARGGGHAVAKAYQLWTARSAGAAPLSGAENARDVEASRAAAPAETTQATRAAASAYRAAAAYAPNANYSTSAATGAVEAQLDGGPDAAALARLRGGLRA